VKADRQRDPSEDRNTPEPLEKSVDHLLEECRMVLPGVQALFGFQLIAVFNKPFFELLNASERALHLCALVLAAIAVAMLMAPAAYHRQAEPQNVSARFVHYTSALLTLSMVPLMIALSMDVYLIARIVLVNGAAALGVAALVFLVFTVLWFVVPWTVRRNTSGRRSHRVG
jgi:hypothetical protein